MLLERPWRQGRAAEQRSVADPNPVLVWSSSNAHKETSVPAASDTYHAATIAKNAPLFNDHLQMLPSINVQESNARRAYI